MNILCQFFHKESGSQEDNQAPNFGCPNLFFGRRGQLNFASLCGNHRYGIENSHCKCALQVLGMPRHVVSFVVASKTCMLTTP